MLPQISQLFIYSPDKSNSTCKIFIAMPSLDKEQALGKLFGIIEVETVDRSIWNTIDSLVSEIEENYYGKENTAIKMDQPNKVISVEETFEQTVKKTNDRLIELIKGGRLAQLIDKLNIIIGVLKNGNLYFSQVGNTMAFLIHAAKTGGYRMVDILEGSEKEKVNPFKILANITSGELGVDDSMFFCTASLLDYLSLDKMKQILTTQEPPVAARTLKDLLLEASINTAFAAILIKLVAQTNEVKDRQIQLPQRSLEHLLVTEQATESYLSPSFKINLRKYSASLLNHGKKIAGLTAARISARAQNWYVEKQRVKLAKESLAGEPELLIEQEEKIKPVYREPSSDKPVTKALIVGKTAYYLIINFSQKFYAVLKPAAAKTWLWLKKFAVCLFYLITNKNNLRAATGRAMYRDFINWLAKWVKKIKLMPRMSQALLAALLIVAVILIYSVATLIEKKGNEQQVSQFNQLVEEIKTKKDLADASLIYNDEDKARRLLNEAQLLIGQLPQTSRQNKKTAEDLAAGIEADLVKIRHLYEIPDPIGLANLASAVQGQYDLDAGELILTKDKIYSFNKKDNTLFQINAADRNAQKLNFSSPTNDRFQLANFNSSDNSILFYHDGNGLAKLDLKAKPEEQKIVNLEINLNGQEGKVRDIATYGNKLYILSSANNQIYKYSPTLTGFGAPANWLKRSDREIKNGVSITIDGALYLLESTGQVQKFASGVPQKFELIGLDPAFSSPTKIWTDENSKFLYILDPNTRRLAVFAKDTGKLIAQYTSPKFDALKDFAVNEKEKKIYILNDNIVYGIVANHL